MEITINTESATVTLNVSGTYTAEQLRQLIDSMAKARKQIAADPETPLGQTFDLSGNARWHIAPLTVEPTTTMLLVCLSGIGWHGITLDPDSRRAMIQLLINQESMAIDHYGRPAPAPGTGH